MPLDVKGFEHTFDLHSFRKTPNVSLDTDTADRWCSSIIDREFAGCSAVDRNMDNQVTKSRHWAGRYSVILFLHTTAFNAKRGIWACWTISGLPKTYFYRVSTTQ